ncbi:hypothetical protein Tco_0128730 [Tanacetum coccineum]
MIPTLTTPYDGARCLGTANGRANIFLFFFHFVISHVSLEDLQNKLKRTYGDKIQATPTLLEFDLNYQTGEKVYPGESTSESFSTLSISIRRYDILSSSWAGPPKLKWRLVFANVKAGFPNTELPCKVLYARNLDEFMKICQRYDIESLPGGRTIEELCWIRMFRKKMIVDPLAEWTNNTTTGLYEDVIVRVMRIDKRTNIVNTIKRVRHDEINDNILRFYGWQEQSDFYYFAYEKCEHTLAEYVGLHNFTEFSGSKQLRLDILRFVFEEEIEEEKDEHKGGRLRTNMHDFAKILLYCTSGGSYKFSDQKVGDNELKLCKIVEARDLIKKILNDRKVGLQHVLGHHFFWSTLERISFVVDFSNHIDEVGVKAAISRSIAKKIKQNKVFENRWDSKYCQIGSKGLPYTRRFGFSDSSPLRYPISASVLAFVPIQRVLAIGTLY